MVKAISNLLAALILLAIVVGVGVGVAMLSGAITQRLQPTGASLNIQSVRLQALRPDRQEILVEVVATVTGAQSVRIDRLEFYWYSGGVKTASTSPIEPSRSTFFTPGSTISIMARFRTTSPPKEYDSVRVVVRFCDTAGACYRVSGSGVLEPYKP